MGKFSSRFFPIKLQLDSDSGVKFFSTPFASEKQIAPSVNCKYTLTHSVYLCNHLFICFANSTKDEALYNPMLRLSHRIFKILSILLTAAGKLGSFLSHDTRALSIKSGEMMWTLSRGVVSEWFLCCDQKVITTNIYLVLLFDSFCSFCWNFVAIMCEADHSSRACMHCL